jgi:ubiquinol-cytochrome c reductase core subunit 2
LAPGNCTSYSDTGGCGKATTAAYGLQDVEVPHTIEGFHVTYADTGMFGFIVTAHADKMAPVLKIVSDAAKQVANGVKDDELARAKTRVASNVLLNAEDGVQMLRDLSAQTLGPSDIASPFDMAKLIQNVTSADVQTAAKKLSSGKLAMGAVGKLSSTPYLDQL